MKNLVMASINIKNVGPIKNVSFDLNRINVFIGPQSSGKSTIAKIVSFCLWLEKDALIHQYVEYIDEKFMEKNLLGFHKLQSYFEQSSFLHYKSDIIEFTYTSSSLKIQTQEGFEKGKVGKNAYIPAERNLLSMEGITSLPLGETNFRSFLFDWLNVHTKYTREKALSILKLNVKYYYQNEVKQDRLILENGKEISLREASSGLQSVVPLYVYLDYITRWVYENTEDISFEKKGLLDFAASKEYLKALNGDFSMSNANLAAIVSTNPKVKDLLNAILMAGKQRTSGMLDNEKYDQIDAFVENISRPHFSNIIIEEPEQNLFPETQVAFMIDLLSKIDKQRDKLTITTHSPYILYALNNCLLGGLVKDNVDEDDVDCLAHENSWIDPHQVSVWALKDGQLYVEMDCVNNTIQDEDGLIRNNYFDKIMKNVMADFSNLMNYYEPYE